MGLLGEFSELLLPRRCAGCGRENVSLCTACLQMLGGIPRAMEPRYGQIPIVGVCEYNSRISRMVIGFKDEGRRDILDPLALALTRSVVATLDLIDYRGGGIRLFPAPSSARARRRRGGSHTAALARRAMELAPGLPLEVHDVLRAERSRDQVGLGAKERANNAARTQHLDAAGLEIIRSSDTRDRGRTASADILVDDFSTTGATLAESARLLTSVQIRPAAGAVLGLGRGGTRFVSPFTV
ncbi:ComF family protein [Brevibacterium spongiae]|uniref:ComF family protein n=1 Tax=Brevibacterium spongiae TaxID=2909672 RepID=A0ABY5SXK2_9MICO|nr:ComF family protein [Brevibacterium spongiae]UVI37429.1 ComF family protein [Brevibacterium spongiae]